MLTNKWILDARRLGPLALASLIGFGCGRLPVTQAEPAGIGAPISLSPCVLHRVIGGVSCGTFAVPENRDSANGRRIDLNIVLLRRTDSSAHRDPLIILAGGPGQGAAELASQLAALLALPRRQRDIVLVDQRGTGRSN